ncbi:MAG: copper resistance protein NlpE N-terminal domain-containing protein, partial [Leclercia adecarboxylata]|nr:copper resistance protein NlpE N-terminal domain-containing protein [Leclercia adecarboxylata]
ASTLFVLMGCHNRAEMQALEPTQAEALKPMQQSWRGVLPCADCEGIETSLFLEKDGSWVMNQHYQGAKAPSSFASYGTWARTADKLVLTDTAGEKRYFRAKGEGLEMLDMQGNPIESQFNYTLAPVTAALPATPQLERDYAAARGSDTKPVLLTVDGHFTLEANPDSGERVKTLVPDRDARFEAGKNCDSK